MLCRYCMTSMVTYEFSKLKKKYISIEYEIFLPNSFSLSSLDEGQLLYQLESYSPQSHQLVLTDVWKGGGGGSFKQFHVVHLTFND